jgi:hypothetical protein
MWGDRHTHVHHQDAVAGGQFSVSVRHNGRDRWRQRASTTKAACALTPGSWDRPTLLAHLQEPADTPSPSVSIAKLLLHVPGPLSKNQATISRQRQSDLQIANAQHDETSAAAA